MASKKPETPDRGVGVEEAGEIATAADEATPASGADTLTAVLRKAEAAGFGTQFIAQVDATITCKACDRASDARSFEVAHVDRLEGASDAADLMIVLRATCPKCGAGGVLAGGYGPNASDADVAIMPELDLAAAAVDPS